MKSLRQIYYRTYLHRRPLALYAVLALILLPAITLVLVLAADSMPAALFVSCLFTIIGLLVRYALSHQ